MKSLLIHLSVFGLVLLGAVFQAGAQDASQLLKNMDNVIFGPKDKQGNVKIILIDKDGKEKAREAIMLQKGTDKKLFRYTAPESQVGIATLSLPDGVMWLYMPAFGKPKKISLLARSQAFSGTDFSYEDMATSPYSDRFTAKLLETRNDSYVLELVPGASKSDYSRIIATIDKTSYYPKLMEYFDNRGNHVKTATYVYQKIGKYWNAKEVTMTDLKKQHSSKIIITDVIFDQGLTDDQFTEDKLLPQ